MSTWIFSSSRSPWLPCYDAHHTLCRISISPERFTPPRHASSTFFTRCSGQFEVVSLVGRMGDCDRLRVAAWRQGKAADICMRFATTAGVPVNHMAMAKALLTMSQWCGVRCFQVTSHSLQEPPPACEPASGSRRHRGMCNVDVCSTLALHVPVDDGYHRDVCPLAPSMTMLRRKRARATTGYKDGKEVKVPQVLVTPTTNGTQHPPIALCCLPHYH